MHLLKLVRRSAVLGLLFLTGSAGVVFAQGNSVAARARALNNELLRLQERALKAAPNEVAAIHSQAASVAADRAAALVELMDQDASEALKLGLPDDVLEGLSETFPGSAAALESHGIWQGTIESLEIDDTTMTRHRTEHRLRSGAETLEIHFSGPEPAGLKCNDQLRVSGLRVGKHVAVEESTIVASEAAAATCSTMGAQKIAVIMVNFPSYKLPSSITGSHLTGVMLGNSGGGAQYSPDWSVDDFWRKNSDGKAWIERNSSGALRIVGPYLLSADYDYCSNSDTLRRAAYAAADADLNYAEYSRVAIVVPALASCGYAGVATLGCWGSECPGDGVCNISWTWWRGDQISSRGNGVMLSTHEMGHNLTMGHASSREFANHEPLGPFGTAGTLTEYGDYFSTMGSWNLGFYNAPHAVKYLGWMGASHYTTIESNGSYNIAAFEAQPFGAKALKVRRGTGNNAWLWMEYREGLDIYDSRINAQVRSGALIHYDDGTNGNKTHLADFTPADNFTTAALSAGQSWTDPYSNLTLSVNGIDPGNHLLNVTVSYGSAPCVQANPTVSLSPLNQTVEAGSSKPYTVSITNTDTSACPAGSFSLSGTVPSGWSASLSSSTLSLAPGQTGTATMTVAAPAGAAAGTYDTSTTAEKASYRGTGAAVATVPVPAPSVTVAATCPAPCTVGSVVVMVANVSGGPGAAVTFKMTKANGSTTQKKMTANSSGVAIWEYTIGKRDPSGNWSVYATAK